MQITDFLAPDRIILDLRARDKPHLIREIARSLARLVSYLHAETVEAALLARETLGSTGLGNGFALPHARIQNLQSTTGLMVRLAKPVEFDAIDGKPVNMVFVLLTPLEGTTSHVAALAAVSRRFRDVDLVTNLRKAKTPAEAYGLLTAP